MMMPRTLKMLIQAPISSFLYAKECCSLQLQSQTMCSDHILAPSSSLPVLALLVQLLQGVSPLGVAYGRNGDGCRGRQVPRTAAFYIQKAASLIWTACRTGLPPTLHVEQASCAVLYAPAGSPGPCAIAL